MKRHIIVLSEREISQAKPLGEALREVANPAHEATGAVAALEAAALKLILVMRRGIELPGEDLEFAEKQISALAEEINGKFQDTVKAAGRVINMLEGREPR